MWVALVLARENDPDLELKVYVVNLCLCTDDISAWLGRLKVNHTINCYVNQAVE